jgi:multidrug resistance efflux pump
MKNKKLILACLFIGVVAVAGGIAFYYRYEGARYFSTEDARVAADTVNVTPQISGRIAAWNVTEGSYVKAGANIGWQDTGSVASSSGISVSNLNQVGSLTVNKAEITAPISGRVIKSAVQPGQFVSPGQTIAIIASTDDMYVSANVKELKINQVKVGQSADISIDAFPGRKFKGRVEEIGQATVSTFSLFPTQSTSGNYTKVTQLIPVKIRFPESGSLTLLPGMSVEVKIHLAD